MNHARTQNLIKHIVTNHSVKLGNILSNLNNMNKPNCTYNMDEKGDCWDLHYQQGVLAKKEAKRVQLVCERTCGKCHSGILWVVTLWVQPLILFKGKRLKPEWSDNLPPGSKTLMTAKASMTTETFKPWLVHFKE